MRLEALVKSQSNMLHAMDVTCASSNNNSHEMSNKDDSNKKIDAMTNSNENSINTSCHSDKENVMNEDSASHIESTIGNITNEDLAMHNNLNIHKMDNSNNNNNATQIVSSTVISSPSTSTTIVPSSDISHDIIVSI